MLAKAAGPVVPIGDYLYEPKWDGFRCLVFVLEDSVVLQSRSEEDIAYAFPEVVGAASALPVGTVLDGELAVVHDGRIDFGVLSSRLRPRSEVGGHIDTLAQRHPALFIAFDLLATPGADLRGHGAGLRHQELADLSLPSGMVRTPATTDAQVATGWLEIVAGAGLDGVIAKPQDSTYQPGVRALTKVKPESTADVVVAGWRPHKQLDDKGMPVVGSLLLGVYDDLHRLHHIGSASAFSVAKRLELTDLLAPLAVAESDPHPWRDSEPGVRIPDTPNRWRRSADKQLMHVRPDLVAEVRYDSLIDQRFRHVARLLRWRPDRDPHSCNFDQFPEIPALSVAQVLTW
jgi:ATP-dependent DNA ligase